jgi:ABC-2 type transport system permease protein
MNRSLTRIFTLFTKDLKDAVRDARVLIALIVPLGIGVFYNYSFDDSSIDEIKGTVAIAAADATQLPDLIQAAVPSNVHLTFETKPDQAAVEQAVSNEDADIGLVVPAGFDQAVQQGAQPALTVIRSPKPSVPGDYVLSTLEPVLRQMAGQEFPVAINITDAAEKPSETILDKIGLRTWSLTMAIVLMLALVSALAIPIVLAEEFEKKTIDALVLAMPYREVIIAKALLGLFYIAVMVTVFVNLTQLDVYRWGLFLLGTGLTGVALLGFGLLLAGTLKNANQLNTWSGVFLLPFLAPALIVGQPAPELLRQAAGLLPSGAGMKLLLNSVTEQQLFAGNARFILILVLWAAAAYLLLLWQLKRRQALQFRTTHRPIRNISDRPPRSRP